jgi:hypothetical protein
VGLYFYVEMADLAVLAGDMPERTVWADNLHIFVYPNG